MKDIPDIDLVEELIRRGVFHRIPAGMGKQFLDEDVNVINRSAVDLYLYIYWEQPNEPVKEALC